MRVALVAAPYDTTAFRIGENLGVKYLAAVLEQRGITTDVFEPALQGTSNRELSSRLLETTYDLIGFSVMFDSALVNTVAVIADLRTNGCSAHITIGGHVPTFNSRYILRTHPEIDSIVKHEGEETLLELVDELNNPAGWRRIRGLAYRLEGNIVENAPRPLIQDLDRLPFPVRDETSRHLGDPHYFVVTTRGCPFVCTFCSIPSFYKAPDGAAWRARSVANVVAELKVLSSDWQAQAISFLDDEFLVSRNGKKRAASLSRELRNAGLDLMWSFECRANDVEHDLFAELRDGGLRHVFVGIESGVQRVLDTFDKRTTVEQNRAAIDTIRELGLSLAVGFIMFDPDTTTEELRQNLRFLLDMRIASYKAISNKVLVYTGTRLETDLASRGRLRQEGIARTYQFANPDVELAYRLMARCLEPYHQVDVERRRLEFQLDNTGTAPKPALPAIQERFEHAERAATSSLYSSALEIISFAERSARTGNRIIERFEDELRDEAQREASRQVDELAALQLEVGSL